MNESSASLFYDMAAYKRNYRGRKWGSLQRVNRERFKIATPYSREQFFEWLDSTAFDEMLLEYFETCVRRLHPTIDRVDSTRGYLLENMRVIIAGENSSKRDRKIEAVIERSRESANPFERIESGLIGKMSIAVIARRAGMSRECWYNLKKKWPEVYVRLDWLEELFKEFGLEPNEFFRMGK